MAEDDPFSVSIDSSSNGGSSSSSGGDTFSETSEKSWFARIKEALIGILVGFVLLAVGVVVLFWNEGRAVQTAKSLNEGAASVIEAASGSVDPANENKLIHLSGTVAVQGQPSDTDFAVRGSGYGLQRKVEFFQWKEKTSSETRKKLGGGEETVTTYQYEKLWSDRPIDSGSFKHPDGHRNPAPLLSSRMFLVPTASLGAFQITGEQLSGLGTSEPVSPSTETQNAIKAKLNKPVTASDTTLFVGQDSASPQVGDLRVSYLSWTAPEASFVARQSGKALGAYQTKAGDALFLKDTGSVPASTMFKEAQDENKIITWVLRLVGIVVLFIAFGLMFRVVSVLADIVPIFGDLVGFGTGLIALLLTALVGSVTIGLAWLYYRPLVGIAVIAAGIAIAFLAIRRGRQKQATASFLPAQVSGAKR